MMQLYTVTFTTRAPVKKFDRKGKLISETPNDKPVTMTALPYSTAMSYSGCDNFKMEHYVPDDRYASRGPARPKGVGNGAKRKGGHVSETVVQTSAASAATKRNNAAKTGDLGAAINA